ncbi:MAG: hypothetical protein LBH76_02365, partial [Propionibacteriaceae bacterium]|nr:hypothetical protein [Propionibacteriaceae bacterium]
NRGRVNSTTTITIYAPGIYTYYLAVDFNSPTAIWEHSRRRVIYKAAGDYTGVASIVTENLEYEFTVTQTIR